MPITEELKNVKKFESVGFSHEQAEALAESLEHAQISGLEGLKDFIRNENQDIRKDLSKEIGDLRNDLSKETDDLRNDLSGLRKDLSKETGDLRKDLSKETDDLRKDLSKEMSDLRKDLSKEISDLHKDLSKEFNEKINALEIRMLTSQKDMLIKIFGIIVGTVGIAVTILKLFP